jgi:hypothetical protein
MTACLFLHHFIWVEFLGLKLFRRTVLLYRARQLSLLYSVRYNKVQMPPGSADFVHRRRKASSDNPRLSGLQHFRKRILPPSSPTTVLRLPFSDLWLHPDARVRALASAPRPTSSDLRLPTWWLGHPAPDRAAGILPASSLSRHFASFAVRISSL